MLRRALLTLCLCAFAFSVGCESDKPTGSSQLDYSKEGPPKREGVKKGK